MQTIRRNNHYPILLIALIILLLPGDSQAVGYDFSGQLSGWTIESRSEDDWDNNFGLRYIPRLILEQPLNDDSFFDTEVSFNGFLAANSGKSSENSDLKLYRLKLRFATTQTETRIGLQKINFGPALLLRPLRWFDRLDLRDPLQLTEGVYGLRFKYNALNNANFWFWCLYGNDDTKGYETLQTSSGKPEFGGRLQYPVPYGELAATFHTRNVDASLSNGIDFTENRFALDGKWDIGIGLWFEGAVFKQNSSWLPYPWQQMLTLGIDYTFGIGNGLNAVGEHFIFGQSSEFLSSGERLEFSAVSLNYPLGLLDSLSGIVYYDWENRDFYRFINWQRTYDRWQIYVMGFWNPEEFLIYQTNTESSLFTGTGFQIMVVYNY